MLVHTTPPTININKQEIMYHCLLVAYFYEISSKSVYKYYYEFLWAGSTHRVCIKFSVKSTVHISDFDFFSNYFRENQN